MSLTCLEIRGIECDFLGKHTVLSAKTFSRAIGTAFVILTNS